MVLYYNGLKDYVKDKLAKDRPTTYAAMMEKAILINNRIYKCYLKRKNIVRLYHSWQNHN